MLNPFSRPTSLAPAMMGTSCPLRRPIRRLKKGMRSLRSLAGSPATSKIPAPSRKKVLFSGKKSGNRVRFTWRLSASVSAKSVLTVTEAFKPEVMFLKTSIPTSRSLSPSSRLGET